MVSGGIRARMGTMVAVVCLWGTVACPAQDDEPPNTLPTAGASSGTTAAPTGTEGPGSVTAEAADTTAGGSAGFPAVYRFDCIDIIELGDSDEDGQPDGDAIQATVLENVWSDDIDDFKLNVMLVVRDRDDAAGSATVVVGSGVGPDAGSLCTEPTTAGAEQTASFEAGTGQWQPSAAQGACSEPAEGNEFGGTYTLELSPDDTIYVYAEDDDGTVFNCDSSGGAPNAVPLHAVRSSVTVDPAEQVAAGRLTGCLVDAEAQTLCSCLDQCSGNAHPDCGGCPDGSTPLSELLGEVLPTDQCTRIMGERAYDLTVGFTSVRLSGAEPMACGG